LVEGHAFGWSFSPDRVGLAAGSDVTAELRIYDLRRLRALGDVKLNSRGLVYATTWAGRSRVLGAVVVPGCCGLGDTIVTGVDADSRRILWRRDLGGSLQAGAAYRGGFVLVLGPKWAVGPSRLAVVSPDGGLRMARLDQIRSGWHRYGGSPISHQWNPGLALDPASGRALVVQAGAPVADVDLRRLAVSGVDYQGTVDSQGHEREVDVPAGLKLIDTRTWSVRTLDHTTSAISYTRGVLFAYGTSWDSQSSKMGGSGLTAYDPSGHQLYHRYGQQPISGVTAVPRGVLVGGNQGSSVFRHQDLLEPRSGRVLGRPRVDVELITGDQPFWF
jgi:hypothetical protein